MKVEVKSTPEEIVEYLTKNVNEMAEKAIKERGIFTIGVSGGSIIKYLAQVFEKSPSIDWLKWAVFFCDERLVTFEAEDSTYGQFKRLAIDKLKIPTSSWFPIDVKRIGDPVSCAEDYQKQLAVIFEGKLPSFDLLLLGMGPDGHTCSLFPNHPLLKEGTKWVADIQDSPKPPPCRVTLTLPVVNNARNILFLCTGASKADKLHQIKNNEPSEDVPSSLVRPTNGDLVWLVDEPAAAKL